jgi:hypothetical protein
MSAWLRDLRYGVAAATAAESDNLIGFSAVGLPPAGKIGIYGVVMPEKPDEAIALSLYVVSETIETVVGVQFRFRAKTDARLDAIEDSLSNSWVHRQNGTLNGVTLILSSWSSGASLGQDSADRLARSANYYLTVERPLRHRT